MARRNTHVSTDGFFVRAAVQETTFWKRLMFGGFEKKIAADLGYAGLGRG